MEANIGMCVNYTGYINQGGAQVEVQKQGWKIMNIMANALRVGDNRYIVRSNFGNGDETDVIFPARVTQMYACPNVAAGQGANNVQMVGGRRRRGRRGVTKRATKKSRKGRKASKRTRKH
jgi:hypothetical protein